MASEKLAAGLVNSGYSVGWVGACTVGVTATETAVTQIISGTNMTTDPRVLPISITGTLRTLVNSYDYSGVGELGQAGRGLYGIYDPSNWSQKQTAQCNATSPVTGVQQWSTTNPYGIVVYDGVMYMIANDCDPTTRKCYIYKYNMAADAFSETGYAYEFTPDIDGDTTQWKGAGYGLDLQISGSSAYLIAVFGRFTNSGWTYTFGESAIVKIPLAGTGTAEMDLAGNNVTGVVVNGDYAYVTSVGGAQQANGNPASKLEVFDISGATPSLAATIAASDIPNSFGGDFVDVAFVNNKAYVLAAHYNTVYSQYSYIVIQTMEDSLQHGELNTKDENDDYTVPPLYVEKTVSPASPCFALLPGEGNDLYLVDGVKFQSIDTSLDIDAAGALSTVKSAGDFANGTATGYVINTAAMVIERTAAATRGLAAAKASVTKIAKRLARPEDLERKEQ